MRIFVEEFTTTIKDKTMYKQIEIFKNESRALLQEEVNEFLKTVDCEQILQTESEMYYTITVVYLVEKKD